MVKHVFLHKKIKINAVNKIRNKKNLIKFCAEVANGCVCVCVGMRC